VHSLRERVKNGTQLLRREAGVRSLWANMQTNALPAVMSQAEQQFLIAMDGWVPGQRRHHHQHHAAVEGGIHHYMTLDCRIETEGDLGMLTSSSMTPRKAAGGALGLGRTELTR